MNAKLVGRFGLVVVLLGIGGVVSGWAFGPGDDDLAARVGRLESRLERLEDAVGKVRLVNTESLDQRLRTLERGLRQLAAAGGQSTWSSPMSNLRELREMVEDSRQQQRELDSKLERLAEKLRRGVDDGDVRAVRREVERLRNDVRELGRRLSAVERRS